MKPGEAPGQERKKLARPHGNDNGKSKYMPEDYVAKLADSRVMTIRHLLPSLEQRVTWPEQQGRRIVLVGTRGEVPLAHRDPKEPILVAVPPGTIVVGYELWRSLGLKPGDAVSLLGRTFKVSTCYPQRGSKDDITVWIDLDAPRRKDTRTTSECVTPLCQGLV